MLTSVQNFLETVKPDGKPERLSRQYEGTVFFPPNPASTYIREIGRASCRERVLRLV